MLDPSFSEAIFAACQFHLLRDKALELGLEGTAQDVARVAIQKGARPKDAAMLSGLSLSEAVVLHWEARRAGTA